MISVGCERLPTALFSYSPEDFPEAGDTIWFFPASAPANSFEWDLGDGTLSLSKNPLHVYEEAGIYEVRMTAFNENGSDNTMESVTIYEPTTLGFYSYDSTLTEILPNTTLWIYDNEADRDSMSEPLLLGITDENGYSEFRNIEPEVYHIWAFREELDGYWSYRGFTSKLVRNKLNVYNIPCIWKEAE